MSDSYSADGGDVTASALPASRLEAVLALFSVDEERALQTISQSSLFAHLPNNEARHRLTVRINSNIQSQNSVGYKLAHMWLQQDSTIWDSHLVNHASSWATQLVNLLSSPAKLVQRQDGADLLASALELAVSHIFAEDSTRQEFHRQVVTPNLPKCVQSLAHLLDFAIASEAQTSSCAVIQIILDNITRLIHSHPSQFRSVSAKLTDTVSGFLYRSEEEPLPLPLFSSAAQLLTALHLTGALASKGTEASGSNERITQAQLWQMTLTSHLRYATEAWRHAVSSYTDAPDPPNGSQSTNTSSGAALKRFPKDPILATKLAYARLALFLGSRGRPGLVQLHLRSATPRPVPVPVGSLLTLASDMLRIDYLSRQKPTSEAKLCAMQATHLPIMHTSALTLIAQVAVTAPKAFALQASGVLSTLCHVVEVNNSASIKSGRASSRLHMGAFATLALVVGRNGVGTKLDPAGRTTIRLARIAAGQVASALLQPESSARISTEATEAHASSFSRKAKKARLYESDAVFGSSGTNPKDFVQTLRPETIASTISALEVLAAAYPCLVTGLSAQHHDLTRLGLNITIALIEILSDSLPTSRASASLARLNAGPFAPTSATLLVSALTAIGAMCADAPSSVLALAVPRILPLLTRLTQSAGIGGDVAIRHASSAALSQVDAVTKGKFVPIARGVGFGSHARDDFEPVPERARLTSQAIPVDVDPSATEKDVSAVLGSHDIAQDQDEDVADGDMPEETVTNGAGAAPASPPRVLPLPTSSTDSPAGFSPDPVKPTHRPMTPRIGSPTASPSSTGVHAAVGASRRRSRPSSPSLDRDAPTTLGGNVLGALPSTSSTTTVTAQQVFGSTPATSSPPVISPKARESVLSQSYSQNKYDADEDDDDEEMPEIDMRSSDDESSRTTDDE